MITRALDRIKCFLGFHKWASDDEGAVCLRHHCDNRHYKKVYYEGEELPQ